MSELLVKHKKIWNSKKILRVVYADWYSEILRDLKSGVGKTVELGAGSGNFKEFKPDIISSDIEPCEWLDSYFDAHNMPFKDNSISNIVMIDVFHHLDNPLRFLFEAARVLERGGKIIMIEPYPTPFSLFVYRKFHPEPFLMKVDYFAKTGLEKKDPWQANQAMAYLLFFKFKKKTMGAVGDKLKIVKKHKQSCLLYPLSGGFENRQIISDFMIPLFRIIEFILIPFRFFLAFRCYIILEKN